ncbi:hypothetical protein Ddye_029614 [Dipteronia dyeriana]|uniref:Uncharacterized protein n=1 Tax=Dipteronia dyeriana TaxID=168575 RepID=A0AAD9TEW5_9ROSI|nr:hypothetical protein Ddye_029614 [Dipteronia dyeriana]
MDDMDQEDLIFFLFWQLFHLQRLYLLAMDSVMHFMAEYQYNRRLLSNRIFINPTSNVDYINGLISYNDTECIAQLRMDRRTFIILCELLRNTWRLKTDGLVCIEE